MSESFPSSPFSDSPRTPSVVRVRARVRVRVRVVIAVAGGSGQPIDLGCV